MLRSDCADDLQLVAHSICYQGARLAILARRHVGLLGVGFRYRLVSHLH